MAWCSHKTVAWPVSIPLLDTARIGAFDNLLVPGDLVFAGDRICRNERRRDKASNETLANDCAANHALLMGSRVLVGTG